MVRQLIRIGFDRINGFMAGGFEAWQSAGLPTESAKRIDIDRLKEASDQEYPPMILDVRQRSEFHAGHIKGALNIELGELQEQLGRNSPGDTFGNSLRSRDAGLNGWQYPSA